MGTAELRILNTAGPDDGVSSLEPARDRASERMARCPERGPVLRLLRETVEKALAPAWHALRPEEQPGRPAPTDELRIPVPLHGRAAGVLVLGPRRSGEPYTAEDLRFLRLLVNTATLALGQAKTRRALAAACVELEAARQQVAILEGVRSSLEKFVPKTVRDLLEQPQGAAGLAKRDVDVSVLFVDIVGYTRLSEHLPAERASYLVERYFGAFLDEILTHGGDVNELAGDGLMIIFQDPDPRRHARSAVRAALGILRRTREINRELRHRFDPIALHAGVNSGRATLGVTRIEGQAGARWTYTACGLTTNLAARLAELGSGDAVMVGPVTRQRLAAEFPFEELGEIRLRSLERPVAVARLALPAAEEPTRAARRRRAPSLVGG